MTFKLSSCLRSVNEKRETETAAKKKKKENTEEREKSDELHFSFRCQVPKLNKKINEHCRPLQTSSKTPFFLFLFFFFFF